MDQRAALGWALHDRGDEVAARVLHGLEGSPSYEVLASIAEADRLATQVLGRWLATGEAASEEEHARLSGPGSLVGVYPLPQLLKAYLAWRAASIEVLEEQAARLGSPAKLVAEVRSMIERSCDASLVRMGRQFDAERGRLERELAGERSKLAHQALHDPLTALPNRVLLYDRLTQALLASGRYGGDVALLFVDLDGFKDVNDQRGHETGDQLLVAVAQRVRRAVRPSDTPARIGGDEFVVLCDRLPEPGEAERVADRILAALREPFVLGAERIVLSASIGIALARPGEGADEIVGRADTAMYAAKRRGDARELAPAA
jgi:diguanylate cyclase (GGDEF)-like protein